MSRLNLRTIAAAVILATAGLSSPDAAAQTITAPYSADYSLTFLGGPTGVPSNLGGLTFLDSNTLLIGGTANGPGGAIYSIGVTRDAGNHVTGFSGPAVYYAAAPRIDGGLAFGPGGVLFYTTFSDNMIGQIKPGSTAADRIDAAPVTASVGTLQFVPAGFSGAGRIVVGSYSAGVWASFALSPDGNGTYDLASPSPTSTTGGGPEGIIYVAAGSPDFAANQGLVSSYGTGSIRAYGLDAFGNPVGPYTDFITGLTGAEGATIDPLTNDFLFSTFGGGNQVVRVSGFSAPAPVGVPEPGSLMLVAAGLLAIAARRRR